MLWGGVGRGNADCDDVMSYYHVCLCWEPLVSGIQSKKSSCGRSNAEALGLLYFRDRQGFVENYGIERRPNSILPQQAEAERGDFHRIEQGKVLLIKLLAISTLDKDFGLRDVFFGVERRDRDCL